MNRTIWLVLAVSLLFWAPVQLGALELPPVPQDGGFVQDFADILEPEDRALIESSVDRAFNEHDTAIVVLTIDSMSKYGSRGLSIESFAQEWFDHWGIGKRRPDGSVIDKGMLLLVSIGDRRLRIELGEDWGHRWDGHCQDIVDDKLVPSFKKSEYSAGIREAVIELHSMVEWGPQGKVPVGTLFDRYENFYHGNGLDRFCFFSPGISLVLLVAGSILFFGALITRPKVPYFTILGIGLIGLGTFSPVALFVLIILLRFLFLPLTHSDFESDWNNHSGCGGGGGGGGGGGASGSW